MKKTLLFAGLLSFGSVLSAQQTSNRNAEAAPATPAVGIEQHSPVAPGFPTLQYSNDVIIGNDPTEDQRRVRISVAFNGWLYASYSTVDSASNSGGITTRMSRDNGATWTTIDSYSSAGIRYPAHDIVVAGTDTNSLVLYVVGVNYNTGSGNYILFVDRYNGTTGAFTGSNFNQSNGTRPVYDVALACDDRFPAVGASPYSVGLLYSTYSPSYDSINFLGSMDGGATWTVRHNIATTGSYNRKVSLSYGRSASGSNGRYFGAWERLPSQAARTGNIYTSRSQSTVDGPWITPVNLDSVSSTMIGLCSNPQIATCFGNVDSDSGGVTAVVLVQRDYIGDGSDYDLLGFYNKRAHFTSYWNRLDIVNSGENDLQPDISYDPTNQNFLAVYYDSTNGKLPYLVNGINLTTPSAWTTITPQYNDNSTNLKAAWPRVEINPLVTQTAHAWIAEGVGTKGVAMFDAEYVFTDVNANAGAVRGGMIQNIYPSPAQSSATLLYLVGTESDVVINVYNAIGEVVETRVLGNKSAGEYNEVFDVSSWSNGVYMIEVVTGANRQSTRLIVSHNRNQ